MHGPRASRRQLCLYLCLLPLVLFVIACALLWQAMSSLAKFPSEQEAHAYRQQLLQIQADLETGTLYLLNPSLSGPVEKKMALHRVETLRNRLDAGYTATRSAYACVLLFAKGTMIVGALTLLVGATGVVLAALAGRQALQSRESLVKVFTRAQEALPWMMATQALLLAVTICLVSVTVGCFVYAILDARHYGGPVRLEAFAVAIGLAATWIGSRSLPGLRRTFEIFQAHPMQQWGRATSEAQAPALWQHIRTIAAKTKAQVPKNIVLGLTDGFYVTAHDMLLMPEQELLKGTTLYLPLTYAALLRPVELDCIIGHELGHFSGSDAEYSLRFVPLHAGMTRSLGAFAMRSNTSNDFLLAPALLMGEFLLERVHQAVAHWSREREFAADQTGILAASSAALASALIRVGAISPLIDAYLNEASRRAEDHPTDILRGLLEYAGRHALPAPDLEAETSLVHPTDMHPSTRERINALDLDVTPALLATACSVPRMEGIEVLDKLLRNRLSLQMQLARDISVAFVEQNRAYLSLLQTVAQDAHETVVIHERIHGKRACLGVGAVVALLIGTSICIARGRAVLATPVLAASLVLLVTFALICSVMRQRWRKRGEQPVAIFSPRGVSSSGLGEEIPWSCMDDINAVRQYGPCLTLQFFLSSDTAPNLIGHNMHRLKWIPKQHLLELRMTRIVGFSYDELLELMVKYRIAAYARAELETMDGD